MFFQRDSQRCQELVSAYVVPESIRCVLLAIGIGLLIFGVYNLLSLPIA